MSPGARKTRASKHSPVSVASWGACRLAFVLCARFCVHVSRRHLASFTVSCTFTYIAAALMLLFDAFHAATPRHRGPMTSTSSPRTSSDPRWNPVHRLIYPCAECGRMSQMRRQCATLPSPTSLKACRTCKKPKAAGVLCSRGPGGTAPGASSHPEAGPL